jgi:hypothetical protein
LPAPPLTGRQLRRRGGGTTPAFAAVVMHRNWKLTLAAVAA